PQIENSGNMNAMNSMFTSVSKAVLPSVVTIRVVGKEAGDVSDDGDNGDNGGGDNNPYNFFHRFFGGPNSGGNMPFSQHRAESAGSGVIISGDGYIITNNHVVEDASEVKVYTYNRHEYVAKVIGTDPSTDLAVVKIEATGLTAAAFGNSDNLEIGEWVEAIGNPFNLSSTVTAGIISAKGRPLNDLAAQAQTKTKNYPITDFIQTDAAINPGNSGGGLFDMNGTLVGINSAIATNNGAYEGYGFAIPVNIAKVVAEDLIKDGKVNRGYIGVTIREVNDALAEASHLDGTRGVAVNEAKEGSAGAKAGLRTGDIILSADGQDVNSPSELQAIVAEHHAGDKLVLQVWRDGKQVDVPVTLKSLENNDVASNDQSDQSNSNENGSEDESVTSAKLDNLGITVHNLDDKTKSALSVDNGVKVTNVNPYSDAAQQGLQPGDVIVKADYKPVSSVGQLEKLVKEKKTGDSMVFVAKTKTGEILVAVRLMKQLSDGE
ncbi:MAG TPA: Do family serine endopeptidase, partial [Candidatus Kapabacteria bacterium]|nr:Do family serine endopeptidase [Candidatus Kapabacteria bacterium]